MKRTDIQSVTTDVLVIGGGAAGLRAAIAARQLGAQVLLVCESPAGFRNNTAISKATFAAAGIWKGAGDSPEVHLKDTMAAGRFLNDRKLVTALTTGVRQQVYDLLGFGVSLRQREGDFLVGKTPGHSYPRQISAENYQGIQITRPLRQYAAKMGVQFLEGVLVTRLLKTRGRVVGATGIDTKGRLLVVAAKSTVLATGGAGEVYLRTNNAVGSTGDGYALAYEAGVVLRDMEFVQFYPTAFGRRGNKMCMYEWFLPLGATIRNSLGEDILVRHSVTDIASATRDRLTRLVMEELAGGRGVEGGVVFDLSTIPPSQAERLHQSGLKVGEARVIVSPTVHFFMGGIAIDENAETGIRGLYAAVEVCGGVHGANRLGGNAIGEALVFGTIAGHQAATAAAQAEPIEPPRDLVLAEAERLQRLTSGKVPENLDALRQSLKQVMWDKVGVIRDRLNLEGALQEIKALQERLGSLSLAGPTQLPKAIKLGNMLLVAEMVCRAALTRTESRGAHYRADYPKENDEQWLKVVRIHGQSGEMRLQDTPLAVI